MEKVKRASLASPLTHKALSNSRALPESLFPSVKWAQLCPRCSHCRVTSSELRMTDEHCSLSPALPHQLSQDPHPFLSSSTLPSGLLPARGWSSGLVLKARGWLQGLQVRRLPRWALTRT